MTNTPQTPLCTTTRLHGADSGFLSSSEDAAGRTSSTRPHERGSIAYSDGVWWLIYPDKRQSMPLNQSIKQCRWNVGCLCQSLSIGKRTFSRMVSDGLGITCKMWLRQIRIVAACHLLRENRKIEIIARELGFRHLSDFTKEFKKMVGVSPSFYMKAEYSRSTGFLR